MKNNPLTASDIQDNSANEMSLAQLTRETIESEQSLCDNPADDYDTVMITITTHSQEEFDMLVQAGMDCTQEPSDGIGGQGTHCPITGAEKIPFTVTNKIANAYASLMLAPDEDDLPF